VLLIKSFISTSLYFLLSNKLFLSLKAAGPRSRNGAACASLQQYGFAIAHVYFVFQLYSRISFVDLLQSRLWRDRTEGA